MISQTGNSDRDLRRRSVPIEMRVTKPGETADFSSSEPGRRRRKLKSFTLVELLVAVSILTVCLVGVLGAYARSAEALKRAQDNLEAVSLLKRLVGELEMEAVREEGLSSGTRRGSTLTAASQYEWEIQMQPSSVESLLLVEISVRHVAADRSYRIATRLPSQR